MQTKIRKIGNSEGAIIPLKILRSLNLKDGDDVIVRCSDNQITIEPARQRPKYKLADLLAQCDPSAPMPQEIKDWDEAPAVGKEVS